MNRWDIGKVFSKVSSAEFKAAVTQIQDSMAQSCGTPVKTSITFYSGVPHSITSMNDDVSEYLQAQRLKMIFAKVTSPADVTDELWDKAVYVEARVDPVDEKKAPAYAFGHIEAKGLRPKSMSFYVQPERVGGPAQQAVAQAHPLWRKGDGMESNHVVTYG